MAEEENGFEDGEIKEEASKAAASAEKDDDEGSAKEANREEATSSNAGVCDETDENKWEGANTGDTQPKTPDVDMKEDEASEWKSEWTSEWKAEEETKDSEMKEDSEWKADEDEEMKGSKATDGGEAEEKQTEEMPAKEDDTAAAEEDEKKEEEPAEDDSSTIDIGWEAAAWMKEEDSKRFKHLQELAGVEMEVDENGKLKLLEVEEEEDALWAKQCIQAMCAMRTGEDVSIVMDEHPSMIRFELPEEAKTKLKGKSPEKFVAICETAGVIAAFVEAKVAATADSSPADTGSGAEGSFEVGEKIEAEYDSKWHEATVLEVTDEGVKIKWSHDESEDTVQKDKAKKKASEKKEELKLEVGMEIEAKYDEKWNGAVVQEITGDNVKIKWLYDDSEGTVTKEEVRKKEAEEEWPKEDSKPAGPAEILIIGEVRPRLEMELRVLNSIEQAVPGHEAENPRLTTETEEVTPTGLGWTKVALLNDGAFKGRVIGKGGSVRKIICKVAGSEVEFLDKVAYMVGTTTERKQTVALLHMCQTSGDSQVEAIHPDLEDLSSHKLVPRTFLPQLSGKNRQPLNDIEIALDVLIFFLAEVRGRDTSLQDMTVGTTVEAKNKDEAWKEAVVLEVVTDPDDEDYRAFRIKWTEGDEEAEVPAFCARMPKKEDEKMGQRTMIIIGQNHQRQLAELKTRRLIEEYCAGTYPADTVESKEDFGLQVLALDDARSEFSQSDSGPVALERVARAAGCLAIEPVGKGLHLLGTAEACERARCYVLAALTESTPEGSLADAWTDKLTRFLPANHKDRLVEASVREIEKETKTLIFLDDAASSAGLEDQIRVVVCGSTEEQREVADQKLQELEQHEPPPKEEWPEEKKDDESWGENWKEEKDEWNKDSTWEEDKGWNKEEKKEDWKDDQKWGDNKDDGWNKDDSKAWNKDDGWNKNSKDDWNEKEKWGSDKKDGWNNDDGKDSWNKKRGHDDNWGDEWKGKQAKKDEWSSGKDDWNSGKDDWNSGNNNNRDWKGGGKEDWKEDQWKASQNDWEKKDEWKGSDWNEGKDDWRDQHGGSSSSTGGWGNSKGKNEEWQEDKWNQNQRDDRRKSDWGGQDKRRHDDQDDWNSRKQQKGNAGSWNSGWNDDHAEEPRVIQPPQQPWVRTTPQVRGPPMRLVHPSIGQPTARPMPRGVTPSRGVDIAGPRPGQVIGAYLSTPMMHQVNQVPQISRQHGMRPAVAASIPPPQHSGFTFEPVQEGQRSNPEKVLEGIEFPDTIADWEFIQDVVWEGWPPLPPGWIRVWSTSERREYFLRLQDEYTTYDEAEMS